MTYPKRHPSARTYSHGQYAVSRHRFMNGADQRMLHCDSKTRQQLKLNYDNCSLKQFDAFISHFNSVKGTHGAFRIAEDVFTIGWATDSGDNTLLGMNLMWRYASEPRIRSRFHGTGTLEVQLETVPGHDDDAQVVLTEEAPSLQCCPPSDCYACPTPPAPPGSGSGSGGGPGGTDPVPDDPGVTPTPTPIGPIGPTPTPSPGPGEPLPPQPPPSNPCVFEGGTIVGGRNSHPGVQTWMYMSIPGNASNTRDIGVWGFEFIDATYVDTPGENSPWKVVFRYWRNKDNRFCATEKEIVTNDQLTCNRVYNPWCEKLPLKLHLITDWDYKERPQLGLPYFQCWYDDGSPPTEHCPETYDPKITRITIDGVDITPPAPPEYENTVSTIYAVTTTEPRVTNSVLGISNFPNISPSRRVITYGDHLIDRYGDAVEVTHPLPSTAEKSDVVMDLTFANRDDKIARYFFNHYDHTLGGFHDFALYPVDPKKGTFAGWDAPEANDVRQGRWIYAAPPRVTQTHIGTSTVSVRLLNTQPRLLPELIDPLVPYPDSNGVFPIPTPTPGGGGSPTPIPSPSPGPDPSPTPIPEPSPGPDPSPTPIGPIGPPPTPSPGPGPGIPTPTPEPEPQPGIGERGYLQLSFTIPPSVHGDEWGCWPNAAPPEEGSLRCTSNSQVSNGPGLSCSDATLLEYEIDMRSTWDWTIGTGCGESPYPSPIGTPRNLTGVDENGAVTYPRITLYRVRYIDHTSGDIERIYTYEVNYSIFRLGAAYGNSHHIEMGIRHIHIFRIGDNYMIQKDKWTSSCTYMDELRAQHEEYGFIEPGPYL